METPITYYTPRQLGRAWGLREGDVKLLFANDPRMEKIRFPSRDYFRIPESAAMEVYEQHGQTWGIFLTAGEKAAWFTAQGTTVGFGKPFTRFASEPASVLASAPRSATNSSSGT
jgi:hypothetical protein